ncbi:SIMPL domain-containing protein [Corynebacterium halotolerans]|uniref:SIMPL domain-containing protein n=1 Tax=Corynebacterium halotolerans TaxID=225326 RepID=UPI003CE6BFB5
MNQLSQERGAPTVTATGEAGIEVRTDRAELTVTVAVHDADQQACLRRRREAVAVVRTVLARVPLLGQEDEKVHESVSHDRVHQASWSVTLVLPDAADEAAREQLVEAISRLSGAGDCQLSGPDWSLSPAARHAAHSRALGKAGTDARAQAEAMVTALGGRISGIRSVTANSHVPLTLDAGPARTRMTLAAAEAPLPERQLEINAEPALETVRAAAEVVCFAEFPG